MAWSRPHAAVAPHHVPIDIGVDQSGGTQGDPRERTTPPSIPSRTSGHAPPPECSDAPHRDDHWPAPPHLPSGQSVGTTRARRKPPDIPRERPPSGGGVQTRGSEGVRKVRKGGPACDTAQLWQRHGGYARYRLPLVCVRWATHSVMYRGASSANGSPSARRHHRPSRARLFGRGLQAGGDA